jgi:hypothetical protein
VGLLCRSKICFHAKVYLNIATGEPNAAAFRKFRWLWNFGHCEDACVESAGIVFAAGRHRELYVVDLVEKVHV